tara:strand:+ start:167 stop:448 length:282 start_codon:yes stop_codon:yes gene_type:complete
MTEKILTRTEMIEELRLGPAKITFTKVNGDTRIMEATLDTSRIPEKDLPKSHIDGELGEINQDVIRCYDLKAAGWRSFRVANIVSWEHVLHAV